MSNAQALFQRISFKTRTRFLHPQKLQEQLAREFLDHKASPNDKPAPIPKIITFEAHPVYTTGRREHGTLSEEQLAKLKAPRDDKHRLTKQKWPDPEVFPTQRGGQITFHGPGQTVFYPILDLKAAYPLWPKGLSPRCYVNLLEQTTINTLAQYGLKGIRTENPGVWAEDGHRKIAALGVHLRRNITSYGVGLNVTTDLRYFKRIVACGLEGKEVTSMKELAFEKDPSVEQVWRLRKKEMRKYRAAQEEVKKADGDEPAAGDQVSVRPFNRETSPGVGSVWVEEFLMGLYGKDDLPKVIYGGMREYNKICGNLDANEQIDSPSIS